MAKVARPLEFIVVLDANALRGKNWLQSAISELLESVKKEPKVSIEFYIPEVVQKEWIDNFVHVANILIDKNVESATKLRFMLSENHEVHQYDKKTLAQKGQKQLDDLGIQSLKMNYSKISVKGLLERALNKQPPFKQNSDAGFKDALIAETIFSHASSSFEGQNIVVITGDKTLRSYLLEKSKSLPKELALFDSIPDFESHLKLKINELSDELATKAKLLFYSEDRGSLFYKNSLGDKVESAYKKLFPDDQALRTHLDGQKPDETLSALNRLLGHTLPTKRHWRLTDKQKLEVSETVFLEKKRQKLLWENTIIFVRYYRIDKDSPGVSSGLLRHRAEFKVVWQTSPTQRNLLSKPEILGKPTLSTDNASYQRDLSFAPSPISTISELNSINNPWGQTISPTNNSTWTGLATTPVPSSINDNFIGLQSGSGSINTSNNFINPWDYTNQSIWDDEDNEDDPSSTTTLTPSSR